MAPLLNSGDVVIVQPSAMFAVGDVVLAEHPFRSGVKILKRIAQIEQDGRLHLVGDNPDESTDSRTFGKVPSEQVLGRVVAIM